MNSFKVIALMIFSIKVVTAQSDQTAYAFKVFDAQMYHLAVQELQKAYIREGNKVYKDSITLKMGICYAKTQRLGSAIRQFEKIIDRSNIRTLKAEYALALMQSGQHGRVVELLKDLPQPNTQEKRLLQSAQYLMSKKEKAHEYLVFNIESVNSPMSDFCPILTENKQLIITSNRKGSLGNATDQWTGQPFSDIYISQSEPKDEMENEFNTHLTTPIPVSAINTRWHEGSVSIHQNTFYYTQCNKLNTRNKCRIYSISKQGERWQEKKLVIEADSVYNAGHPSVSKDGKTLFFSSDMRGFGKKDIFKIIYNSDTKKWSKPKNMGKFINTDQDEMYPYIDDKGIYILHLMGR